MTNVYSSNRVVTGLAGSVQKRKTLVLHQDDPRAKDSFYINNYVGEIVILNDDDYLKYLKTNQVKQSDDTDEGVLSTTLHPPTNVYWDPTDPASIEYNQSNASSLISLIVTFDPATDEISTDGEIQYTAVADISNHQVSTAINAVGGADSTNANATKTIKSDAIKKAVVLSTVSYTVKTTSNITLKWKGYENAIGYEVNVTGLNLDVPGKKTFYPYHSNSNLNANGYHFFTITPKSGYSFSGSYSFKIATKYTDSTTKAVTYSVTI
jgi:lipid II:glycine glycyltransferase (peptidoglycan interpeptide bridge formation enzyme)